MNGVGVPDSYAATAGWDRSATSESPAWVPTLRWRGEITRLGALLHAVFVRCEVTRKTRRRSLRELTNSATRGNLDWGNADNVFHESDY